MECAQRRERTREVDDGRRSLQEKTGGRKGGREVGREIADGIWGWGRIKLKLV